MNYYDKLYADIQRIKDELEGLDYHIYYKELSDELHTLHENLYQNLDFSHVIVKQKGGVQLLPVEKGFLNALSGQTANHLSFPIYWTLEHHINYYELITKLIENWYVEIAFPTNDISFLTGEQLKAALKSVGLKVSGKKQEQIGRLLNSGNVIDALKSTNNYTERFFLTALGKEAINEI